jgi:thioredoxin-related protein
MKTGRIIIILCLLGSFTFTAAGQAGIRFFQGSYAALLAEAQQQHKMIFIDVYTDWCGPCKQMDKNIFPLKAVGDKYNPLFLNYRLNAEKGEGVEIARKFNINAYPSFLYLSSDGQLIHKVAGEGPADVFNSHADKVVKLATDKNRPAIMEAEFKSGNRQPDFLRAYISSLSALSMDNSQAFDEWLKVTSPADLEKEDNLVFIARHINGIQTGALVFLMAHYDALGEKPKATIKPFLYNLFAENAIPKAIGEKRLPELQQLMSYVHQLGTLHEKQAVHMNRINLIYAGVVKNTTLLKQSGYEMVGRSMDLSIDSIHSQDARRYDELMAPFLKGEKDSTQIPGFQEEKAYIVNVCSREVYAKLFTAASSFCATLDPTDKALEDALKWALRAEQLIPAVKANTELITKLRKYTRAGSR